MQHFTQLKVWRRSHKLALTIYHHAQSFPPEERYGLTSQLRRASLSVPTNIAEGSKRRSNLEFAHSLNVAEGSLAEVEYLIIFSRDVRFLAAEIATALLQEISEIARMLNALQEKVLAAARLTPATP
jgi:four helix bundle protein